MKTINVPKKKAVRVKAITRVKKATGSNTHEKKKDLSAQQRMDRLMQDMIPKVTLVQDNSILETVKEMKTLLKEIRTAVKNQPQLEGIKTQSRCILSTTNQIIENTRLIAERMNNLIVQNNETHRLLRIVIELWK